MIVKQVTKVFMIEVALDMTVTAKFSCVHMGLVVKVRLILIIRHVI